MSVQDGVVARRQLVGLGLTQGDLNRLLRRRELTPVHRATFVAHTGPLTWDQRAWAAVLVHHPAALTRASALPDPPATGAIHVAVDVDRTVRRVPGVVAHRTARWRERLAANATRPRLAVPEAVVELVSDADDSWEAFAALARVCQSRRTTPGAVRDALRARRGLRDRPLLLGMVDDLATGACSVLEREYLTTVERAHGLPTADRQGRERLAGGVVYRDAEYVDHGVVVELDGRTFHSGAGREADFGRDLLTAATSDRLTLRLGWRQVVREPCRTAHHLGAVLGRRGWAGQVVRCPRCSST